MTSIYKIAEMVKARLDKGTLQIYISDVIDAYSYFVKASWYENQKADVKEVAGQFIVSFGIQEPITPTWNEALGQYYIENPSSYINLPAECGLIFVGFARGQNKSFVRTNAGSYGRLQNIKAGVMGGRQLYYIEGTNTYFPIMSDATAGNILMKLAVALDNVDIDAGLSIPRDMIGSIVDMVVQKHTNTPQGITEKSA